MRSVTLLAVEDIDRGEPPASRGMDEGTSSTGDTRPEAEAATLFLPKVSFHFDGFLLGGGVETTGIDGGGALRIDGEGTPLRGAASKAEGIANIDTGSNGSRGRLVEEPEAFVDMDLLVDEDFFEALLISRANDCEASARLASVSSLGVVKTKPLPFRAPLFLRLLVDVDLEA